MNTQPHRYLFRLCLLFLTDPQKIAQAWRRLGVSIGEGTAIYRNVTFGRGGADPIFVGKNCVLTGCSILGHDASTNMALGLKRSPRQPVIIEDNCFIGLGAIVLMGVRVGHGSIVGAGAVVTKDVPPGSVVAGNPARVISSVDELVDKRRQQIMQNLFVLD
jgi:acetyltransferase-like isoleucine patch superfamily enzyme